MQKRNNNDIWKNLFEFYLIEDKSQKNAQNVFQVNLNLHKNVICQKASPSFMKNVHFSRGKSMI